jgi:hypothetical protein
MPELTPVQVRSLAASVGFVIADADLADVTLRLNATLERLTALDRREDAERDIRLTRGENLRPS